MRSLIFLTVTLLLVTGCASLSREECQIGDWEAIGRDDGAEGRDSSAQFARHQRACARVDIAPDRTEWLRGYNQGLARYCTPIGGLDAGAAGRAYRDVCPASTEPAFLEAYRFGERAHRTRQEIARVEAEISSLRSRHRAISGSTDPALRREIAITRLDLLQLDLQRVRLRGELRQIDREVAAYRRQLL